MSLTSTAQSSSSNNIFGNGSIPPGANCDEMDPDTAALIAQLYLEDLEEIYRARKGKARADAPRSDAEQAAEAQKRYFEQLMTLAEDEKLARSIGTAVEMDQDYLNAFLVAEAAAVADRRAAELLSRGESLPEPTAAQTRLESRDFIMHPEPPSAPPVFEKKKEEYFDSNKSSDNVSQRPSMPTPVDVKMVDVLGMSTVPQTVHDYSDTSSDEGDFGNGQWSQAQKGKSAQSFRPTPAVVRSKIVECVICSDQFRSVQALHAPCDHYYCRDCVKDLVNASIRDESLFPVRCCQQEIPINDLDPFIAIALRTAFRKKHAELSVLSKDRVYCVTPTCSRFLGSAYGVAGREVYCLDCGASTCPRCKQAAHGDEDCIVHASTLEVKALAKQEGWQSCPGCDTVVELDHGCYHMTCRCRTQFCYLCAMPWKNCECVQWDESRLLATAQQRVENELGTRAVRNILPEIFQQRVQERARTLKFNHHCERHNWRYRPGGGRCEECHHELPNYLLVCRGCSLLACVRCSRNRL